MDFGPQPSFSWSRSRHDTLEVCARRYYWRYYRFWRGWEDGADEEAHRAWILKKLTGLRAELGRSLHRRAFEVGFKVAQGLDRPDPKALEGRTREELNRVVAASRDRSAFLASPSHHPFLRSAWYGDGPAKEEVEAVRERLEPTHRRLTEHPIWDGVDAGELEVLHLDDPDVPPEPDFELDGVPVYAEPDLLLRRAGDERHVVVDWKSGREREDDLWQVALYGLQLRETRRIRASVGRVEYLASGESEELELGERELDRAEELARESIEAMRALLEDPGANRPRRKEDFPMVDRAPICRWCDFYELCEPELGDGRVER